MSNEQENKQKRLKTLLWEEDEERRDERIGLWVALGAAAAVVAGVLGFSVFGSDAGKAAMGINEAAVSGASVAADNEDLDKEFELLHIKAQTHQLDADDKSRLAHLCSISRLAEIDAQRLIPVCVPTTDENASDANANADASVADAVLLNNADDVSSDDDTAKVVVEDGIVKFYFASGKADLADNAIESLQIVVDGVKEGKKAIISGYADSTGNVELNEQLSKERAFQVRSALLDAGIPESSIEMVKPKNITGTGAQSEARRVEVVLE